MPWVVGIDEAGYGPNLGPLVQAAVCLRLPDGDHSGWEVLRPAIRRANENADDRILVDDSKLVHAGSKKLQKLGKSVHALLGIANPVTSQTMLERLVPAECIQEMQAEKWYRPNEAWPEEHNCTRPLQELISTLGVQVGTMRLSIRCPEMFNKIITGSGNKSTVLGIGLADLISHADQTSSPGEPIHIIADKQGGRTFYAPLLQSVFPHGWIVSESETPDESHYRVANHTRDVQVTFRARADSSCVCVALASMLAKYVRELSMLQFNRFWIDKVDGLKPTAGYPVDAKRFFDAIAPHVESAGLNRSQVWREK